MKKKEIWVEGTFAGEITMEEREVGIMVDDDLECECRCEEREEACFPDDMPGWNDDPDCDAFGGEDESCDAEERFEEYLEYEEERLPRVSEHKGKKSGCKGKSKRKSRNKEIGRRGERAAARYLERKGYEILELNYTCPFGEADIVARDGVTLTFIEVKTRTDISRGFPSEAVDARKRERYEKIAAWYLGDYDETDIPVRFDVVAILVINEGRAFLRHYVDAFGVGL